MAKPSTTHVIEIETGIGEPAFIPLTLGQELQPISVGKKGMWRIESPKVLDVHAFVYFDGTSLFLQSADEQTAATVDGFKVGKAWTELHAPCKIEIGAARLRYRSLLPDADGVATTAQAKAPVAPPRGGPGGGPPRPPTPSRADGAPLTFPKAERPFKPGEFAAPQDENESTRVKPLEASGARQGAAGASGPVSLRGGVRPAAGHPPNEDPMMRVEGHQRTGVMPLPQEGFVAGVPPVQPMGSAPPGMMQPMMQQPMQQQPTQPMQPMQQPGMMMPQGSMPPGMMGPGMVPMGHVGTVPPGMMQPGMGSGPYQQYPPPGYSGSVPMGMGGNSQGGFAGPQPPPQGGLQETIAKYKELSPPKKILVVLAPFCLVAAGYLILFDDDAPPPRPAAKLDGGAPEGGVAAATGPTTVGANSVHPPPPSPCPPGFVPYTAIQVQPGQPIPCVPGTPPSASTAVEPPTAADAGPVAEKDKPDKPGHKDKDKDKDSHHAASHQKTLERQAVDYVAVGEYLKAAAIYDQLHHENPKNPVYVEAARILRLKADAGAP